MSIPVYDEATILLFNFLFIYTVPAHISKRKTEMLSVNSLHFNKVIGNHLLKVNRYKSAAPNMLKLIYPFVFMEICFSGQRPKTNTLFFRGLPVLFVE